MNIKRNLIVAFLMTVVTTLLLGLVYPLVVTGIAQIALPKEGGETVEMWPSLLGGVNMYPSAYNPKTGYIYLAATNTGMKYGFEPIKVISQVRHFGAYQEFIWGYEVDEARDVKTGQEIWRDQKSKDGFAGDRRAGEEESPRPRRAGQCILGRSLPLDSP